MYQSFFHVFFQEIFYEKKKETVNKNVLKLKFLKILVLLLFRIRKVVRGLRTNKNERNEIKTSDLMFGQTLRCITRILIPFTKSKKKKYINIFKDISAIFCHFFHIVFLEIFYKKKKKCQQEFLKIKVSRIISSIFI